jgi:hypothetical protein
MQINSTEKEAKQKKFARRRSLAVISRWLHIYLSMLSFAIVFFFAVTGLTLNHADAFSKQVRSTTENGSMPANWVQVKDSTKINRLQIVEWLRKNNGITAAVSDFRIEDAQVSVSFKGPGYAADVFIDREGGKYEVTKTSAGFVGLINDLHKGRDTGKTWSLVIDIAAVLMVLVSLTGMVLMLFIKRKRFTGLLVALLGLLLLYLIYKIGIA